MGHNIFSGIPKVVPAVDPPAPPVAEDIDESEDEYAEPGAGVAADGADDADDADDNAVGVDLDEGHPDLELPDTASLSGVSLKRSEEEGMAKPASAPEVPRPVEQLPPANLKEYWSRLRRGRRWPKKSDMDVKQIRLHWPNTVLMRCATDTLGWGFESLYSEVVRGGGQSFDTGEIEFTDPMVMEWLLSIGRNAQDNGTPVEDADTFPTAKGERRYKATAVPVGDDETTVNYVLCHVERQQSTG